MARAVEVDPVLVLAIIAVESKGDPRARSPKGARGLMQLMPATAREQAARLGLTGYSEESLFDPQTNVLLGTAYFRRQLRSFDGDERLALAAYNAGPGNVRRWMREAAADAPPGDPPGWEALSRLAYGQTKSYVENVLRYRDLIAGHLGAARPSANDPPNGTN
jgi:soluble lytic murein transglycosylase